MRLLVLGGTSWLGGAVAAEAVRRGIEVTCLARGTSGRVPAGATLVSADRWQPGAYAALSGQAFDASVEVSWQPELVRSALREVQSSHWVYVSSVSAYSPSARSDQGVAGEVWPPWSGTGEASAADYGPAKSACEAAVRDGVPDENRLVARVGLIAGYGDRSDRFGYWPARVASAVGDRRQVLVPARPETLPVQVIDVADLAAWLVHCAEARVSGVYDAVGTPHTLRDVLDACAAAVQTRPELVPVDPDDLVRLDVAPWMGEDSLPLWLGADETDFVRSPDRAEAAGLRLRPLAATVADALQWERELGPDRARRAGLSADREASLLARLPLSTKALGDLSPQ